MIKTLGSIKVESISIRTNKINEHSGKKSKTIIELIKKSTKTPIELIRKSK